MRAEVRCPLTLTLTTVPLAQERQHTGAFAGSPQMRPEGAPSMPSASVVIPARLLRVCPVATVSASLSRNSRSSSFTRTQVVVLSEAELHLNFCLFHFAWQPRPTVNIKVQGAHALLRANGLVASHQISPVGVLWAESRSLAASLSFYIKEDLKNYDDKQFLVSADSDVKCLEKVWILHISILIFSPRLKTKTLLLYIFIHVFAKMLNSFCPFWHFFFFFYSGSKISFYTSN